MGTQSTNRETIRYTLITASRSAGFWSVISVIVGSFATLAGIVLALMFEEIRDFSIAVLIIGLVLLFIALVLSPRAVALFMSGRQGRYGTNIAVMTVAFFAIVVLVNFLLFRTSTRFDTTATRVFTLAPQTVQVLKQLESPVRANAFFIPENDQTAAEFQQAADLLNEFSRQTPNFTYRFIDPQLEKDQAVKYSVTTFPTVVFEDVDGGAHQGVFALAEQDFLTGILISKGIQQKRVYYLTGHDEAARSRDPATQDADADIDGFDFAIDGMKRDNYEVWPLNLRQTEKVPEDAAVLVVAGPRKDLSSAEDEALSEFLLGGGKLLALLDPDTPESYRKLLLKWGILLATDHAADLISNVAGEELTPMAQETNDQFLTSNASGIPIADDVEVAFFPGATAVSMAVPGEAMPPSMVYTSLARTTPVSWLETEDDKVNYDPIVDPLGPLDLGAVLVTKSMLDGTIVTDRDKFAKLIVFGDSDFARNGFFFSSENADLFLNSVNWLADDFELIAVRPKVVPYRVLIVNTREMDFIKWSSWLVPPMIMLVLGMIAWWRRR